MYEVPGSGKHHKRHVHGQRLLFTASDLRWFLGFAFLPPLLVVIAFAMPHGLIWVAGILVMALGALTVRLIRHPGDHHFTSGSDDEPPKDDVPVYDVTIVPTPEEVAEKARTKARNLALMATISAAMLAFARHSQRQADKSRIMHDEIDEALGLPGTRLGYGEKYRTYKAMNQQWVQPPITGLNWQERQAQELRGR